MRTENIDKFGHCVVCHRNLVKNVIINGKEEGVFDADKDTAYMKLNNGSIMPISICKPCKDKVDLNSPEIHDSIMEAVQEGWKLEIDHMDRNPDKFPEWTPDKKKSLKIHYARLKIHNHEAHHVHS